MPDREESAARPAPGRREKPAFGVFYFPTDFVLAGLLEPDDRSDGAEAAPVTTIAREAEARGFESLFCPEHTHIPVPRRTPWPGGPALPSEYWHTLDPFVALAAASAVTTTIRLGTGIAIVPQRSALHLAKEAASLDWLSNGRFLLGVSTGWNVEEMADHGTAWESRWAVTRERCLAARRLWADREARFAGEHVRFGPALAYPKPRQPGGPPILLGATSRRGCAHVVEYGDGWLPLFAPGFAEPEEPLARLRREAERAGRDLATISLSCYALDPAGGAPPRDFLARLLDLGFERIVLRVPAVGADDARRILDGYATLTRGVLGG